MMATSVQLRYTMRSRSASDPVFEVGCKLIENSFPDVVSDEEGIMTVEDPVDVGF